MTRALKPLLKMVPASGEPNKVSVYTLSLSKS